MIAAPVTIGQLMGGLNDARKEVLNDEDIVLWTEVVTEGSVYMKDLNLPAGTILFGIQQVDGRKGTISVEPRQLNAKIC